MNIINTKLPKITLVPNKTKKQRYCSPSLIPFQWEDDFSTFDINGRIVYF